MWSYPNMLNEPASSRDSRPAARSLMMSRSFEDSPQDHIRDLVGGVLDIERETFVEGDSTPTSRELFVLNPDGHLVATFEGRLLLESEMAYAQLDRQLEPLNLLPVFRLREGKPVVHIVAGRVNPQPRPWWPNLLLAIVTFFTVSMLGGLEYAIALMLILGAHELGHYFAARYHQVAVTLPYFIPFPFGFLGTLGAAIQLREPMRNRKVLLDVGAAGPLVGLVVSIPILLIGLATSQVKEFDLSNLPEGQMLIVEGNSILYALAKVVTFGRFLPDGPLDVEINGLAMAGWVGLLVTGLNLLPVGQLDGGHILYSIIGERARLLFYPALVAMVALSLFASDVWFIWAVLILFLGRIYATPLDMITPLDPRRRAIAILGMVLFVLVFVPVPLTLVGAMTNTAQAAPNLLTLLFGG
jgi:Zn-dependent protease